MKSAAGFLKLEPIIKLAVLCEDIVEEARLLQGPASEPFIDWLLLVSDQFERYRKDVEHNADFFTVLNPSLIIKVPHMLERVKQLVAYITAGFPDKAFSLDVIAALKEAGVDKLELGIPFLRPCRGWSHYRKSKLRSLKQRL